MSQPVNIGKYQVVEPLGRGGYGVVYLARHPELPVQRALKLLGVAAEAELIEEAMLQAGLEHPNIVQVFDVGRHQGQPYIVMEYVPGGSLARALEAGPLGAERALALARDLARALEHAHGKGVVHRDLKPLNVLLDEKGRAKIADFGLARLLASDAPHHSKIAGTVAYLAPEQLRGQYTPQSDLWALGCVILEMFTGEPPFGRDDGFDTMQAIAEREPHGLKPGSLPTAWAKLVRDLLAKDPAQRPASAGEVLRVLNDLAAPAREPRETPSLDTMEAADWACARGGPGRCGAVGGGPRPPLKELWSWSAGAPVLASPAMCRGRALVAANNGVLTALDLISGAEQWRMECGEPLYLSPVAVGTAVVITLPQGRVLALDAASGREIWRAPLPRAAAGPPLLSTRGVFQADQAGSLHCLRLVDGSLARTWPGEEGCEGGPLEARGLVVWASGDGLVQAVDPASEEPVWRARVPGAVEGAPASRAGRLLAQCLEGGLHCLDLLSGAALWQCDLGVLAPATPALTPERAVAVGLDGVLRCLEAATGRELWQAQAPGAVSASPCVAGGLVVTADRGGSLCLWDLASGDQVEGVALPAPLHASPALWQGMLLAGDTGGEVRAWSGGRG